MVVTWKAYRVLADLENKKLYKHANVICVLQMAELDKSGHANVARSVMPSFTVTTATGRQLCQALELCDGDVLSLVEQCGGRLTECVARNVFRQVVAGLRHCHARGVWHMDVKPDNMLLKGGCVKLADFGAAVISSDGTTDAPYGTRCYACPESLAALPLRSVVDAGKADVWALGMSIATCVLGFFPWDAAHASDSVYCVWADAWQRVRATASELCVDTVHCGGGHHVCLGATAALGGLLRSSSEDAVADSSLWSLLACMLDPNPLSRVSLDEVAAHPWISCE